jgi:hypothetical protein
MRDVAYKATLLGVEVVSITLFCASVFLIAVLLVR